MDHLLPLPASSWHIWRWVCLRGAGFPAAQVLKLAVPRSAALADQLLEAEAQAAQTQKSALDVLHAEVRQSQGRQRVTLWKMILNIRKNRPTEGREFQPETQIALQGYATALESVQPLHAQFQSAYEAEAEPMRSALHEVIRQPAFQEAVVWQNRRALHESINRLVQHPHKVNAQARQKERLAASYVQRYCVKNDTIGFFGPIGWARFTPDLEPITLQPGPQLVATRAVHFESWGIEALAQKVAPVERVRPWLTPRPSPFFYREDERVSFPLMEAWIQSGQLPPGIESQFLLSLKQKRILDECDGQRTAQEIARHLLHDSSLAFADESEVYEILTELCERSLVLWSLDLPLALHPERALRQHLERIEDEPLRASALTALAELERVREAVAEAAGQPPALDRALGELETTFTRLTGLEPSRSPGKTYAARTLVYEDCRRDVTLELGQPVLDHLGPPLGLLLTSARWFTYQIAQRYRQTFKRIYGDLAEKSGSPVVSLHSFLLHAAPLLSDPASPLLAEVTTELQTRWADIFSLAGPEGEARRANTPQLKFTSAELRSHMEAAFSAPGPGWTLARYCSPDVMLAARSADAIRQGDYQFVLGELHLFNTIARVDFIAQHPSPDDLYNARARDIPQPCVFPIPSKTWNIQRNAISLVLPSDVFFEYEAASPRPPQMETVTVGELVIEDTSGGLQVHTRDRRISFEIIEFFGYSLSNQCLTYPAYLPPAPHTPRIVVDDLVISRESWRFAPETLAVAHNLASQERFLTARRWARAHSLPRFFFIRIPGEVKPHYVDLDSPIYLDIFARVINQALEINRAALLIHITEMLPQVDQTWLTDATGNCYTSELRLVALDPNLPVD